MNARSGLTRRMALMAAPAGAAAACAAPGARELQRASQESAMKITILGSGSPSPSLRRKSSGYMIEIGADVIMLDGGPGTQHRMLEAGVHPTQVTHVFYSHLHYDHFADYPTLVLQRWDMGAGRIPDLAVFGPPPIARTTELLFGAEGAFSPDLHARTHHQASLDVFAARGGALPRVRPAPVVRELRAGDVAEGAGWVMRTGRAEHFQPYLECNTYRLEAGGASLVYTGDSGYGPEVVEIARGCDVLIAMCHFISGTEATPAYRRATGNHMDVARLAAEAGVKLLVLSHFLEIMDRPGVMERLLVEIHAVYDGPVIAGADLTQIPLAVSFPRGIE